MKAIERESPRPNATRAASKRPSECAGDIIRDAVSTPPKDFYWTGFRSPTRSLITSSAPANGKARGLRSCRSCNSADKLWRLKCERSHLKGELCRNHAIQTIHNVHTVNIIAIRDALTFSNSL
jgi:hypothetical protein